MPSFTQRIPNLQQVGPVIEVILTPSIPFLEAMKMPISTAKNIKVLAMIDTGATSSVISQGLAEQLGVSPVGVVRINTPSSEGVNCFQFDIQMVFPNNVQVNSIVVTEAPLKGQHIQCLIGRDLLNHAVLIYTGYDNSFTLSF